MRSLTGPYYVTRADWRRWETQHPGCTPADIESGEVPSPPSSASKPIGRQWVAITQPVSELRVWPTDDGQPHPRTAQIIIYEGLTPTALQRFPWKSMLTVADAAFRTPLEETPADTGRRMSKALKKAFPDPDKPQRPGRRAHPDEFYISVAAEYLGLRADGATDPTKQLAQKHGYNRSTVAGWVSSARKEAICLRPG